MEAGAFFAFKKIIALVATPLSATFLAVASLTIVSRLYKGRWFARFGIGGLLALYVMATPLFSVNLMLPLENKAGSVWSYSGDDEGIAGIVSLACYHIESGRLPFSSQSAECSLRRNVHAVLLHKETGIPLYFSGGKAPGWKESEAEFNRRFALSMGVSPEEITIIPEGFDTHSESKARREVIEGDKILLVTTASHMLRSKRYFEMLGFDVITSPTHHKSHFSAVDYSNPLAYFPDVRSLKRTESAIYEYLGLLSQMFIEGRDA